MINIAYTGLSWTVCYQNNCLVHLSDKEGSGWYSRQSQNQRKDGLIMINEFKDRSYGPGEESLPKKDNNSSSSSSETESSYEGTKEVIE